MSIMQTILQKIRDAIRARRSEVVDDGAPGQVAGTEAAEAALTLEQEVDAFLTAKAAEKTELLDWRHSIVDLLKVLDEPHDLAARRDLAAELGFEGEFTGSNLDNMWLHAQVMQGVREDEFKD